ncbi:MAG: S8 family serine peptidase [Cyanobacteria bacterium J06623_7]
MIRADRNYALTPNNREAVADFQNYLDPQDFDLNSFTVEEFRLEPPLVRISPLENINELNSQQARGENPAFDLMGLTRLRNDSDFAGIDGSGFSVAVIDTGLDTNHSLIAPNYVAGYDFIDSDNDPSDPVGHGTHIAGTIGATDESIGVATDVGLIGLRALDRNGDAPVSKIEAALQWVYEYQEEYNITAVNLSLGAGFFTPDSVIPGDILSDDIRRLEEVGVTVVAAAGNNYFANQDRSDERSGIAFPSISSTIAVGAVWQDGSEGLSVWQDGSIDFSTGADRIPGFSQRLDTDNFILAPGAIITSTVPDNKIGENAGTSQAVPHIAGTVALLQEASLRFNDRILTPAEVNEILRSTGDRIFDGDDEDDNVINTETTYLRVNVYNAVAEIRRRSNPTAFPSSENLADNLVYHFRHRSTGVNFYTASVVERDYIANNLDRYTLAGTSFESAEDRLTGAKPVYRFFNQSTGGHLYTISQVEREYIEDNLSNYSAEGIAYYGYEQRQTGTIPMYRLYNVESDLHVLTSSAAEKDEILASDDDYRLEGNNGIAFYVESLSNLS